jgi:drug/metabolite transporter (DMT)-like permease
MQQLRAAVDARASGSGDARMSLWLIATLVAATAQAGRFYLQKRLADGGLSAVAATAARFALAPPVLALGLIGAAASGTAMPAIGPAFWGYAVAGGLAQVGATILMVLLFAQRAFAVGIAFSKTTVLMAVAVGIVLLGETVTLPALGAMAVGLMGVLLISVPAGGGLRILNRASLYGLGAGALFAVSAVGYRGASLAVASEAPLMRAAVTLLLVTMFQTVLLAGWMAWRERPAFAAIWTRRRAVLATGALSLVGSYGWFTAYTLQTAAYVNAVGQVELILSLGISWILLGERIARRELWGIALLGLSVVALILLL